MCGISFYCSRKSYFKNELENSLSVTEHRGPDNRGVRTYFLEGNYIGLGHNRLSIVDTSEKGNQPMLKEHLALVFNGEIYNFQEIRSTLIDEYGCSFESDTDTEVILSAYRIYGPSCFSLFKGMFAFVLLDQLENKLFIVRDSVGIKPLYIYQDGLSIFGCSEIRGLKEFSEVDTSISEQDVFEFFNVGFLYEPSTGYEKIKKVMPGSYTEINLKTDESSTVFYRGEECLQKKDRLKIGLKGLIETSLERQSVADVPLGIFFSGGADSSILARLSKKSKLLFAEYGDDPSSDIDRKYSRLISAHLSKKLDVVEMDAEEDTIDGLLQSIDFVARNTEELVSDYTFWSTFQLSSAARKRGYIVMLSGMGGDEVFAGYPRYVLLKYHWMFRLARNLINTSLKLKLFPDSFSKKIERLVSYSCEDNWQISYARLLGYFSTRELNSLFENSSALQSAFIRKMDSIEAEFLGDTSDKVKLAQHMDKKGFLAHNLTVSDKASMLASIELRVPLLDEDIVSYGSGLPANALVSGAAPKAPLKKLLQELLPASLTKRPKTGFNPPLDILITKLGKLRVENELSNLQGYLNMQEVNRIVNDHFDEKSNNTYKIWQLLYFSRWALNNDL